MGQEISRAPVAALNFVPRARSLQTTEIRVQTTEIRVQTIEIRVQTTEISPK